MERNDALCGILAKIKPNCKTCKFNTEVFKNAKVTYDCSVKICEYQRIVDIALDYLVLGNLVKFNI